MMRNAVDDRRQASTVSRLIMSRLRRGCMRGATLYKAHGFGNVCHRINPSKSTKARLTCEQQQPVTTFQSPLSWDLANGVAGVDQQHIACPCDVVRDPFKHPVKGSVPKNLETELRHGVTDQNDLDHKIDPGIDPLTFQEEADLMGAVWGAHFDPNAPASEKTDSGLPAQ
jgi:hypothetical protein